MTVLNGRIDHTAAPAPLMADGAKSTRSGVSPHRVEMVWVGFVAVLAATAAGIALMRAGSVSSDQIAAACVFGCLLALAWRFPLPLTGENEVRLDLAVLVATVLLFDPAPAILIAAGGTALGCISRLGRHAETVLHAAAATVQIAAASAVLVVLEWDAGRLELDQPRSIVAIAAAAIALIVVGFLSNAGMALARAGDATPVLAVRNVHREDLVGSIAQVCAGVAAAISVHAAFWTIGLFVLPAFALTVSLAAERRRIARERDALLVTLSHDLRSPLTVIQGQSQLLRRKLESDPDPGGLMRGLERIDETSRAMSAHLTALLDRSRAERPELKAVEVGPRFEKPRDRVDTGAVWGTSGQDQPVA